MHLLSTIEDAAVVRKILSHLGLDADPPAPRPPESSSALVEAC
jgi:hypothetical protein